MSLRRMKGLSRLRSAHVLSWGPLFASSRTKQYQTSNTRSNGTDDTNTLPRPRSRSLRSVRPAPRNSRARRGGCV